MDSPKLEGSNPRPFGLGSRVLTLIIPILLAAGGVVWWSQSGFSVEIGHFFAASDSGTPSPDRCIQTFRSFGAKGDGITDDTVSVQYALKNTSCKLEGEGLAYVITARLRMQGLNGVILNNIWVQNATFLDHLPNTPDRRMFTKELGSNLTLKKVKFDRGTDPHIGGADDSGTLYVSGMDGVLLEDVEVFGDGLGAAIRVANSRNVSIVRPRIHDMRWETDLKPSHEQLTGIWIAGVTNLTITSPVVSNLTGHWIGSPWRPYETDGITATGTEGLTITGASISFTGEGIDITGSAATHNFTITDSALSDIDSWCYKFANSPSGGIVKNSTATRCGFSGFVVSGVNDPNAPAIIQDIVFDNDKAIDTGSNRHWSQFNVAGFSIYHGSYFLDFPQGIAIRNSIASDNQAVKTMKYGFYSDVDLKKLWKLNTAYNVDSFGQTIEGGRGFTREGTMPWPEIYQKHQQIMGCNPNPYYVDFWWGMSESGQWTRDRIIADIQDLKNRGLTSTCAK